MGKTVAVLPFIGDQVVCLSHDWAGGEAGRKSAIVVRQRFFGIFWPLFLAGSEPNRRMTDAAHNQHSETRARAIATLQAFRAFRPIAGSSSQSRCWSDSNRAA
jgi:hypothetical protein